MIVTIHQPNFLPWLGFFEKISRSDMIILLDNVQFEKSDWQNRNRIKGASGPQWLTIPVQHRFPQTIAETQIDNRMTWQRKHWNAIVSNYSKTPYFQQYKPIFEAAYQTSWSSLLDFNMHLLQVVFEILDLQQQICLASDFSVQSTSSERLAELCQAVEASVYIAGAGGHDYLDVQPFEQRQIQVEFQEYDHPEYPQLFGAFVSHLSILDLLFNCGNQSIDIIRGHVDINESVDQN